MLIPVILSGGSGTRLWPVSRSAYPKPFMRMADGQSLLYKTFDRAWRLADGGRVLTVTGRDYYFLSRDEYAHHPDADLDRLPFLLEPVGRNTAPAVCLAALYTMEHIGAEATLLVLPADHLIADVAAFGDDVRKAQTLAEDGRLVTFGIPPTTPETGFGYIRMGDALSAGRDIAAFVEKPDHETAERYVASGNYAWNSGMFCFRADALIAAAEKFCPDVLQTARGCHASATGWESPVEYSREAFMAMPNISIDYALMERAERRAVVPARFDWSDIGSWKAISEMASGGEPDAAGNRVHGSAVVIESTNCFIQADQRIVAVVGVKDLVVVDTGDAVLVADRERAQEVKQVVDHLRETDHASARFHRTVHRPWGSFTILEDASDCKVKRLTVKPGEVLSLQMHHRRSEHWTVVSGTAKVRVGDEEFLLGRNESTFIP
ncbi:MAG TPA: mannose-1-phosphate guanylyltransferase/mannose-6-phosphate isomerase, partial [Rudaea sp.]|nr:mannose-1-phosphate guanylyltransferase/mannose-6-phosphate isomerase [Rudaea sp.]